MPFVIDTASDATVIPRRHLPRGAFPPENAIGDAIDIIGVVGASINGRRYRATLSLSAPNGPPPLVFKGLEVLIVDRWNGDCATLGLDALRQIVFVSDGQHICLWRPTDVGVCIEPPDERPPDDTDEPVRTRVVTAGDSSPG
jgi:hypothetical protein